MCKETKVETFEAQLILFALTERSYMLQLDYKENLEDYEEGLTNYWKEEMKLVQEVQKE